MKRLELHSRPEQFVHVYEHGPANQPLLSFFILFSICHWSIAHLNPTKDNSLFLGWSVCPLLDSGPIGVDDLHFHTGWFLTLFKESFILVLSQVWISNDLEAIVHGQTILGLSWTAKKTHSPNEFFPYNFFFIFFSISNRSSNGFIWLFIKFFSILFINW